VISMRDGAKSSAQILLTSRFRS